MNESQIRDLYARRVAARGGDEAGVHATPEAILAVVRREGLEAARLDTLDHLMSCAACHRDYEWLKAVDEAGLEAAEAGRAGRRPWWQGRTLALAASLVVAVGAAFLVRGGLHTGREPVRGAEGDIVLVAPPPDAAAGGPVTFTWRPVSGVARYVLEVQRADGSVAVSDTTADTAATVSPERLAPGDAYRWWVREVTDGAEPRSSELRDLRLGVR
jgi:hypothetical protein